mmetsp:Transcript_87606/g.128133  ORF Transcript_87606/g.128133 Transcript_87606/m.128133 type:complete len:134 (-) Transcript_87606:299-700(-)
MSRLLKTCATHRSDMSSSISLQHEYTCPEQACSEAISCVRFCVHIKCKYPPTDRMHSTVKLLRSSPAATYASKEQSLLAQFRSHCLAGIDTCQLCGRAQRRCCKRSDVTQCAQMLNEYAAATRIYGCVIAQHL